MLSWGCGADGGTPESTVASAEDAAAGFAAMSAVMQQSQGAIGGLERGEVGPEITFRDNRVSVDVDFACLEGGSSSIKGTMVQEGSFDPDNPQAGGSLAFSFDLTMKFDGCTSQGVTIDGKMTYVMDAEIDDTAGTSSYTFDYDGFVEFTGAVEGACAVEASGSLSQDGSSVQATYEGNICGYSAEELEL